MQMNHDDFLALVNRARRDHPIWFDLPSDEPPDEELLAAAETELGARLPDDFRWFLQEFGGGDFAFATIFSADPGSDLSLLRNQPGDAKGLIAFSDDGTGNLFVFPVEGDVCHDRVLVWDHESGDARPAGYARFLEFVARVGLQAAHG